MLYIDSRDGSIDLPRLFPAGSAEVVDNLPADILFTGDDQLIGIEFKKINDLLSCIATGRFAGHQLPEMHEACADYWLLVEGEIHKGRSGELMLESGRGNYYQAHVGNRYFNVSDLDSWEITMQTKTGLKIKHTTDRLASRDWIMLIYKWWQEGPAAHKADIALDKSRQKANIVRPSHPRLEAETLPGIGRDKSIYVGRRFPTMFDMAVATEEQWCEVEGVYRKMASRIVDTINSGRWPDGRA